MNWEKLAKFTVIAIFTLVTLTQVYSQQTEIVIYTTDEIKTRAELAIRDDTNIIVIERDNPPDHFTPPQTVTIETSTANLILWLPMIDIGAIMGERSSSLSVSLPELKFNAPLQSTDQQFIIALAAYGAGDCTIADSYGDTRLHPSQAYFSGNCALINHDGTQANQYYHSALNTPLTAPYAAINTIWLNIDSGDEATAHDQMATLLAADRITHRSPIEQANLLAHRARLHALLFDYSAAIIDLTAARELQPEDSRLLRWSGEMHLLTYEWDQAETYFSQAIISAPHIAASYYQRGILRYTMARREDALNDFWQAYSLSPFGELAQPALRYIDSIQQELSALQPASD